MSLKYNYGWIKDENGVNYAPNTIIDKVLTPDGGNLADELVYIQNDIITKNTESKEYTDSKIADEVAAREAADVQTLADVKEYASNLLDDKFFIVEFDRTNGVCQANQTFDQIAERFKKGGNMVAHIDGTDYIPLLSVDESGGKIIFSGIYGSSSVNLIMYKDNTCELNSTNLATSSNLSSHTSNNDLHTSKLEKTKLTNIEDNAQVNIIEDVQKNGESIPVSNKSVNIIVPVLDIQGSGTVEDLSGTPSSFDTALSNLQVQVNTNSDNITNLDTKLEEYFNAVKPKQTVITLPVDNWESETFSQSITVDSMTVTDSTIINVMPAMSSSETVINLGIYCSAQNGNTLTFSCLVTIPIEDIQFVINWQDAIII